MKEKEIKEENEKEGTIVKWTRKILKKYEKF